MYIFTQISTCNYMFRPCILAIVRLYYKLNKYLYNMCVFIIQPDDGQYTGPKHVVVRTNVCENI